MEGFDLVRTLDRGGLTHPVNFLSQRALPRRSLSPEALRHDVMPCRLPVMPTLSEYTYFWYSVKLIILSIAYLRAAENVPRLLCTTFAYHSLSGMRQFREI